MASITAGRVVNITKLAQFAVAADSVAASSLGPNTAASFRTNGASTLVVGCSVIETEIANGGLDRKT